MRYLNVSLFAMLLAAAGLPLYIHLPRFATTELGLSLSTVGVILIGIRVLDFVQDPLIGRAIDRWRRSQQLFAWLAALGMAAGFLMLFSVSPPIMPEIWLTLSLIIVFSAYSLGSILFYGQSAAIAGSSAARDMYRLAAFREAGLIAGIILAAIAPTGLAAFAGAGTGYTAFGYVLAGVAIVTAFQTRTLWRRAASPEAPLTLAALRNAGGLRLLLLAFVNSLPVAITSTLFLFFVEDGLLLPDLSGPFLILFFLAAGLSVPLWSRLVTAQGARRILIPAMSLAIISFVGAAALPPGAAWVFGLICVASGAALGADMVILPALFATTLARAGLQAGQAFGVWSFAAKSSLALAAILLLPALEVSGFTPGGDNSRQALTTLTAAYAILPCLLKLIAIALVLKLPQEDLS
ncbi:MFS transporter [Roseovarius sp. CAU 1744]|uniref:MFS transporter n=1 Tax=Roseovarius sp. CAU 1744 TaxID=3140368 RepID=UPI00325AC8D7